jgi:hypothetical protein
VAVGDVGGEFIVAAAQILDERVPGGDDPCGPAAFQAARRPQPGLQPSMIGLDRVIRVLCVPRISSMGLSSRVALPAVRP